MRWEAEVYAAGLRTEITASATRPGSGRQVTVYLPDGNTVGAGFSETDNGLAREAAFKSIYEKLQLLVGVPKCAKCEDLKAKLEATQGALDGAHAIINQQRDAVSTTKGQANAPDLVRPAN